MVFRRLRSGFLCCLNQPSGSTHIFLLKTQAVFAYAQIIFPPVVVAITLLFSIYNSSIDLWLAYVLLVSSCKHIGENISTTTWNVYKYIETRRLLKEFAPSVKGKGSNRIAWGA
jgi:hypothetical protein